MPYEEIGYHLSSAFFMITPSHFDNLPTVGLEALASGTPIIATLRGGWPETGEAGINGYLLQPKVEEIKCVLSVVEQMTFTEYEKMSYAAVEKYKAAFTIERYVASMVGIINSNRS